MGLGRDYAGQDCALARALELLGERWTLLIVRDAFYGVRHYTDFLAHLDVPRAVLAARLQALVDAGVLGKERYQESPPRHEYVLTDRGRALWPALHALIEWGAEHMTDAGPCRLFTHAACGTRLDTGGFCPACGGRVDPADIDIWPGPGSDSPHREDPVSRALRAPHRMLMPLTCEHATV